MVRLKRITLDVLKPHQPSILELATSLANVGPDNEIGIRVVEMDEKTETLEVIIEGTDIDFDRISSTIEQLGGSLHSVDEVVVSSAKPTRS